MHVLYHSDSIMRVLDHSDSIILRGIMRLLDHYDGNHARECAWLDFFQIMQVKDLSEYLKKKWIYDKKHCQRKRILTGKVRSESC
jgi:hypothetical protein